MEKDKFSELAAIVLTHIAEQIELQDHEYKIDVDILGDILSIKVPFGEYIVNKHSAAKEIWLASPKSGPYHFAYTEGMWKNKNGIELLSLLSDELSKVTNISIAQPCKS